MDTFKIQTDGLKSKTYSISYVCSKIQDIKDDFMNITSNIDYDVKSRQAINGMINTCLKQLNDNVYNMDSYIKLMNDSADSYNNVENELLSLANLLDDDSHIPMREPQSEADNRNFHKKQVCESSGGSSSKAFKYDDKDIIALKKGMQDIFKDNDYVNDINFENIFGEIDSDIDYDFEDNVEYFLRNCEAYKYSNRINLETTYKSLPDEYKLMVLMHWVELMKDGTDIDISNALPDEYFENVPNLPLKDSKLGNITSENKYESADAYNYFKKYYYPIQALYQFQKGDFEQLKRTAFMEWARLVYGSSKKEQDQEFRAGLFFGGVTSPIKGIYDTIEGIYSMFTNPEQVGFFIKFVVSLPFSSKNRELMKLMIKQTIDEWKDEYDNADPSDKGFMIGQLIGEAISIAVEAGAFVKGIKGLTQFVKNGGFRKAVKNVVDMGSNIKKLLKMKITELVKSVKKIFKKKDHYEIILNNDELVKVSYDELTAIQKSRFDSLVDSHKDDVMPDRVYGEDGIGGTSNLVDGLDVIDGKVLGKISVDDFNSIRTKSLHNADKPSIVFGRYEGTTLPDGTIDWSIPGPNSYITKAGDDSMFFSLGSEWDSIKEAQKLTDDDMFDLFNVPAIDDAVNSNKVIKFSHDPRAATNATTALRKEWNYLKEKYGYTTLEKIGDFWIGEK